MGSLEGYCKVPLPVKILASVLVWGNSLLSVILGCKSLPSTVETTEFDFHSPHTLEDGVGAPTPGSEPSHPDLCILR